MTDSAILQAASRRITYCGCLCAFLTSLDFNIVNVALPSIRSEFSTDITAASYVIAIYLLTLVAFSPVAGKLCDRFGFGKLLAAGLFIFGSSSLVCGLAPGINTLIIARAVQGVGGAVLFVMGPGLFGRFLEEGQRAKALVFLAASQSTGMCLGPSAGGIITEFAGWEWIFFINVPLTVLAAYWVKDLIAGKGAGGAVPAANKYFDLTGAFLIFAGTGALIYALSFIDGNIVFSWRLLCMLLVALLFFAAFVRQESRSSVPLINLSYFRSAFFSFVCCGLFLVVTVISGSGLIFPFFLADIQRLAPDKIGLIYMLFPVMLGVASIFVIRLNKYLGIFQIIFTGALVLACSMVLYAMLGAESPMWLVCMANVLRGIGYGFFYAPMMNLIVGNASAREHGMVSAILSMTMTVGALLGIRIFEALFSVLQDNVECRIVPYQLTFAAGVPLVLAAGGIVIAAYLKRPVDVKSGGG